MAVSKRVRENLSRVNLTKVYEVGEAIAALKSCAHVKFVESMDVAIQTGVDPRKFSVRGASVLPNGVGRSVKIAVFASGAQAEKAQAAGAHLVGMEDLVESMEKNGIDCDVVIATPSAMPLLSKLGKVLGPKGLMPNPKTGTVTDDVEKAVKNALTGQVSFRLDKSGIVHASIGRVTFEAEALVENLSTLISDLKRAKPSAAKGQYIKKVVLSTTMGPGLVIDINSIQSKE